VLDGRFRLASRDSTEAESPATDWIVKRGIRMSQIVNAGKPLFPVTTRWCAVAIALLLAAVLTPRPASSAEFTETPYTAQKAVFDFYFDEPAKIDSALYWIRSLMNPLTTEPYGYAPEELELVVVIHGTEIVTLAKTNYEQYREAVERMSYYASLGVRFKVCAIALKDFGYKPDDLQGFVQVVPSGITELAHWQLQGYALITPRILAKKHANADIR
jgi:hypothetical protein